MRARPTLIWLHRWLGLTVGLAFTALAVSGSLLLFQSQFFAWVYGDMIPDQLAEKPANVDAWVANAQQAMPDHLNLVAVWRPHVSHNVSDAGMLAYVGGKPVGFGQAGLRGALVAPGTGELLGRINIDRSLAYAPLFFHRHFLAGDLGRLVAGITAVLSLAMLMIGVYLWWPRRGVVRKLAGKPWRNLRRATPLHHWVGVWMALPLLVLSFTGLYLAQPEWLKPGLSLFPASPTEVPKPATCGAPIDLDTAIARGDKLVPGDSHWTALYVHGGGWEITYAAGGGLDPEHGDYIVYTDPECGYVTLTATPATRSPRHTAELWLIYLHDGSVFGRAGEVLVTLLGLAPLVLAWAGILMWLRGRARKRWRLRAE